MIVVLLLKVETNSVTWNAKELYSKTHVLTDVYKRVKTPAPAMQVTKDHGQVPSDSQLAAVQQPQFAFRGRQGRKPCCVSSLWAHSKERLLQLSGKSLSAPQAKPFIHSLCPTQAQFNKTDIHVHY